MYQINRRKEIIKNTIYIIFISLLAIIPTYYIYNRFQGVRDVNVNSTSLDVTYHENTGDKITFTKISPVTDAVGLSSKAYKVTIKNNLTEKVDYKVKLVDDLDKIAEEDCSSILVPKSDLKVSIKTNKEATKIYSLEELEDNNLIVGTMDALEEINVSIRVWVRQDSNMPSGARLHYHGIIQVIEEDK